MLNLQHPSEYAQTCPFPKFGLSCVVNYAETLILMYYFILTMRMKYFFNNSPIWQRSPLYPFGHSHM